MDWAINPERNAKHTHILLIALITDRLYAVGITHSLSRQALLAPAHQKSRLLLSCHPK